jgi:hypothetical protein
VERSQVRVSHGLANLARLESRTATWWPRAWSNCNPSCLIKIHFTRKKDHVDRFWDGDPPSFLIPKLINDVSLFKNSIVRWMAFPKKNRISYLCCLSRYLVSDVGLVEVYKWIA